jgi:energy-coupling factor transporter ATP-binding protein EcfA2
LALEGTEKIIAFVEELNNDRDLMTLDVFQSILTKCDLEYDLSKHRAIVKSPTFEGIIITLRNAEGGKLVLKYKFAFYTAVTMFLREYIRSKTNTKPTAKPFVVEDKISSFLDRWVFDKSVEMQSLWSWILHQMVHVADTQTFEGPVAPWIQASERVYAGVFQALAVTGNNIAETCKILGCPMLEQQQRSLIEVTIALVLGPIGYGKSSFATHLAALIPNSVHIDGDGNEAWLPKHLVLNMENRNSETVAAILSAIQAGKIVVFSAGGGAIWAYPKSGQKALEQQRISFLEAKALEMGIKLNIVLYIPENMEVAYADAEAVKSAIEGRKARGEKWDVPMQKLCDASSANIQFAKRFMKQSVEVHTYPRFNHDANNFASIAIPQTVRDLMSSNLQTRLELYCLRQQQLVSVGEIPPPTISTEVRIKYADPAKKGKLLFTFPKPEGSTFHITLGYDAERTPKPLAPPFFEVGSTQTVPLHHCVAKLSEGTLAPFVFIDLGRDGMHVTVLPGRFKPESMREVALAMQAGQLSAVFVPQQGEPQELTFEVLSSQQVQIGAHHVVSHA